MHYLLRVGSTYYLRVVIPKDLKHHFPHTEIKRSLRTRSKTEARRLLPSLLASLQDQFYQLRTTGMEQPTITAEAVEIFKRLHPGQNTHVEVTETQSFGTGWNVELGTKLVVNPTLAVIQKNLDDGWSVTSAGEWEFVGVRREPVVQQVIMTAPTVPQVQPVQDTLPPEPPRPTLLLSQARELYLEECRNPKDKLHKKPRAEATMKNEQYALNNLSMWLKGEDHPLTTIAALDFKEMSRYFVEERGLSKTSANTYLNTLTRFFKWSVEEKYISKAPDITFTKKFGIEKIKTSNLIYTNDDLTKFFNYIVDNIPKLIRDRKSRLSLTYLILMFLYTGFRKSEQMSFTNEKIKNTNGIKYFDFTDMSKDNVASIRMVPLHKKLVSLGFEKYANKQADKIFYLHPAQYRKKFEEILYKIGVKTRPNEKTFHSCRSTFDSKLMGKVTDSVRKTLMGHTKVGMDSIYLSQLVDDMSMYRDAVNTLDYKFDFDRLKEYLLSEMKDLY